MKEFEKKTVLENIEYLEGILFEIQEMLSGFHGDLELAEDEDEHRGIQDEIDNLEIDEERVMVDLEEEREKLAKAG